MMPFPTNHQRSSQALNSVDRAGSSLAKLFVPAACVKSAQHLLSKERDGLLGNFKISENRHWSWQLTFWRNLQQGDYRTIDFSELSRQAHNVSQMPAHRCVMTIHRKQCFGLMLVAIAIAQTLALGEDLGQMNIQFPEESPFGVVEFILLIAVALAWYAFWLLLNRWNRKQKSFCYWFPTTMVISVAVMLWIFDRANSPNLLGKSLEYLAVLIAWINFPFLIGGGVLEAVWLEMIPVWIRLTLAGIVFWALWHLALRYMRRRSAKNILVGLHLTNNMDR